MEESLSQTDDEDLDIQFLDELIKVTEINKRVIGKVMVKYCGNEGKQKDERTASLWKLLQAVIDFIQSTSSKKIIWSNAEITVYDIDDNSFRIISGYGKHQYVVSDAGNGDAEIINTSNKAQKLKPEKPSHSTTHHPTQVADDRHHSTSAQHSKSAFEFGKKSSCTLL